MNNHNGDFAIALPITQAARKIAEQFARQQPTPEKSSQVLCNTLAVLVVNDYLQMLGIPTDLKASDLWNPAVRLCADVADLELPGVGKLECRPIKTNEVLCHFPLEVWEDRIGYVVVQLDEASKEGKILGFLPKVTIKKLSISQLGALEEMLDRINQQREPLKESDKLVQLSQWFDRIFEAGWQAVEELLNPGQARLAFRFGNVQKSAESEEKEVLTQRAKLIDLGIQLAGHPVALTIELKPEENSEINIRLQVHPTNGAFLPPNLQLAVLEGEGNIFLEAQSRKADNYIQLQLRGFPGEKFSVRISLNEASITQEFII